LTSTGKWTAVNSSGGRMWCWQFHVSSA